MNSAVKKAGRLSLVLLAGWLVGQVVLGPLAAQAAVYWAAVNGEPLALGVRNRDITVCFVGNAVSARPDRVRQIVDYIQDFEAVANIRFYTLTGTRLSSAAQQNIASLQCMPPTQQGNGYDYYAGDIRVVIPNTNVDATTPVPGYGCENDSMTSAPDVASWSWDRLDVFWRGWDNTLRYKLAIRESSGIWRWSGSEKLGGNLTLTSGPSVASWDQNRLAVFARGTDNGLWLMRWNGSSWDTWQSLGGTLAGDPEAVSWGINRLDVFVRWSDNTLRHKWSTDGGATWSGWENLGGSLTSGPGAAAWDVNRLAVFVRGQDNGLWMRRWDGSSWGAWQSLGGTLTADPDAASWDTNRLDVFVRWSDNTLRHKWSTDGGATWSGWENLGGSLASGPAVVARMVNRLDVFAQGGNTSLWYREWNGSVWSDLTDVGDNASWGSWSSEPWNLNDPNHRACLYNLKLGDDPWNATPYRNHTLHEFGHALGLSHEHKRPDANAGCTEDDYGGGGTAGLMTPYDRNSVMHYKFASCGINGNYDHTGLSAWDRLALHIMYPEDVRVAEFTGKTVVKVGEPLVLRSTLTQQGATAFALKNFQWKVDGVVKSTGDTLNTTFAGAGTHTVQFTYRDFLDREYSSTFTVRVLSPAAFNQQMAAVEQAQLVMMTSSLPAYVYLPTVVR